MHGDSGNGRREHSSQLWCHGRIRPRTTRQPRDAAAAQDAAQAEVQEERTAARGGAQKPADMEKRRSAQSRTACDELIRVIRQKWRGAKEEQIDAAALELAECLGGDLAFLTPEQRRRVAQ